MGYKLVFSDIDGTLLNSNHQISRGTKESVWRLKEKGIPFILVSARMPRGIFPLQEELEINEPVICFNGALVLGRVESDGTRKVLFNKVLEPDHSKEIHQLITNRYNSTSL